MQALPPGMRKYVFGFYRVGPRRASIPVDERPKLLADHLAYLRALHARGELIVSGPLEDEEIAGLLVFSTDSLALARELISRDPKLLRGDLVIELREWYAADGLTVTPRPPSPSGQ